MTIILNGTTGITSTGIAETSDGNVGVGTSLPSGKLHVAGGASNVNLYLSNDSYSSYYYQNTGGSSGVAFPASQSYIWDSGGTERMRIDSAGRVTMPYQPAFFVKGITSTQFGTDYLIGNQTETNIGNHFNSSTHGFTAPINGTYVFYARMSSESDNAHWVGIRLNGAQTNPYALNYAQYTTSSSSVILTLSAGDLVIATTRYGGNTVYACEFTGYLLG